MHWRQVDVVCEKASGIPCVCVVLLEGVDCMRVGRLDYWCNSYRSRFLFQVFAGCPSSISINFTFLPLYIRVPCCLTVTLETFLVRGV